MIRRWPWRWTFALDVSSAVTYRGVVMMSKSVGTVLLRWEVWTIRLVCHLLIWLWLDSVEMDGCTTISTHDMEGAREECGVDGSSRQLTGFKVPD